MKPKKVNCGFDPVRPVGVPEYLDTKEAAALLRRSVRTVRRWIKLEILRPRRITQGAQPLFKRAELLKKLEAEQRGEGMKPKRDDPSMG